MSKKIYLITSPRKNLIELVKKMDYLKIDFIQYRNKVQSDEEFIKSANRLSKIIKNAKFIINDRIHLLNQIKCDGIHIGQNDFDINTFKKPIGKHLGITVHNKEQAKAALNSGADLLGIGSLFKTNTKNNATIITQEEIKAMNLNPDKVVIIGGINSKNIKSIDSKLYKTIACSSFLLDSKNIENEIRKLRNINL